MVDPVGSSQSANIPNEPQSSAGAPHPVFRGVLVAVVVSLALALGFVLSVIIGVVTGIIPFDLIC